MAAIELKHVFKKYDDKVTAVNDFNLTIDRQAVENPQHFV